MADQKLIEKSLATWVAYWALLVFLSVALVKWVPYPFLFVLISWVIGFIVAFRRSGSTVKRAICVNIIALLAVFLYLEVHWVKKKSFNKAASQSSEHSSGYIVKDALLGYKAAANFQNTVTKVFDGNEIYSVTYTTDEVGLRKMPLLEKSGTNDCLLFFGGSFTYGEGVEDDEAMPFLVSERTGMKAVSFSLHGYGPHQSLIEVQQGEVFSQLSCNPRVAIYQSIPDHVKRVAGLGQFSERGPSYDLLPGGSVEYVGQYGQEQLAAEQQSIWALLFGKSYIYREYFVDRDWIGDSEVALYLAVVAELKAELQSQYPGLKFGVIFWDTYNRSFSDDVAEGLVKIADEYYPITDMIPQIEKSTSDYRYPKDRHPNSKAHDAMASYLVERLQEAGVDGPAD